MTTHTLPQPTKHPRRPGWVFGLMLAVASALAMIFRYRRTHPAKGMATGEPAPTKEG